MRPFSPESAVETSPESSWTTAQRLLDQTKPYTELGAKDDEGYRLATKTIVSLVMEMIARC